MKKTKSIFKPKEVSLIETWFSLPDPLGRDLSLEGGTKVPPPYDVRPNEWRYWNEWSLSAAVAEILLNRIQKRLPQWAVIYPDGKVQLANPPKPKEERHVYLYPQLLLEIDWGASGPGFSYPEIYHLTRIPLYERFVVTSCGDSPGDGFSGYAWHAIGHFPVTEDILSSCGSILMRFWKEIYNRDGCQAPWGYIFQTGLVSRELAIQWRDSVFPPEEEYEEEEEEDS
ncbi:MAG: hypothetical protein WHX93_09830 [bacterium]